MIALLTANFGQFDHEHEHATQTMRHSFHRFDENNSVPMPSLNNRLRGKYYKTQSHRVIDAPIHIWIDGSVKLISEHAIEYFMSKLKGDIACVKHPSRQCIYQEASYVAFSGEPYLKERYEGQAVWEEVEHYRSLGYPENNGLYAGGIWIRRNNEKVNKAFDWWWNQILTWSCLDQTALPYVMMKCGLQVDDLELNLGDNEIFKLIPHRL